jgi:hypothetical protein
MWAEKIRLPKSSQVWSLIHMSTQSLEPTYFAQSHPLPPRNEAHSSGVSWAAVIAGAFVTAALSLILLALGAGAGLSSLSPWSNSGISPSAVGLSALLFLALVELISASIGGYLAGRLRTKGVDVHTDEVYFRDTAHGFLVWAVALVISAAFLTSAAGAMVGAETRNINSSRSESLVTDANRYYIDSLFRTGQASATPSEAERTEAGLIFAHALGQRELASEDRNYVADRVAAVTGLSRPEAETRVAVVFQQDQQAADTARKAAAHGLYWLFVAMLLGAFCASFAATLGGKQRDHIRTLAAVK